MRLVQHRFSPLSCVVSFEKKIFQKCNFVSFGITVEHKRDWMWSVKSKVAKSIAF